MSPKQPVKMPPPLFGERYLPVTYLSIMYEAPVFPSPDWPIAPGPLSHHCTSPHRPSQTDKPRF